MARERWFFAHGSGRRGPLPLEQLVEALRGQDDPRATPVWRRGLAGWTRAEDVPEVARWIAPPGLAADRDVPGQEPAPAPTAVPTVAPLPAGVGEAKPGSPALVYGGIAAGLALTGLLAWLFWPRSPIPTDAPVPLGGTTAENAPAVVLPAPSAAPATTLPPPRPEPTPPARPAPPAGALAEREVDLPAPELARLRGVAAWAGDTLKLTVYNGTAWRVTEIRVTIGRFVDEDFVEDARPLLLEPPAGAVDERVADLLSRVAPDRKKPGLNPDDTGLFEGRAGPQPESFRWEIVSARGYAPR